MHDVQYKSRAAEADVPLDMLNIQEKVRFMNGEKVCVYNCTQGTVQAEIFEATIFCGLNLITSKNFQRTRK